MTDPRSVLRYRTSASAIAIGVGVMLVPGVSSAWTQASPAEPMTTAPATPQTPAPNSPAAAPTPPAARIASSAPAGFEDLEETTVTDFDVVFQGRSVGSFRAELNGGVLTFNDPQAVAAALGSNVTVEQATALLATRLPSNEQLRCLPGVTEDCGTLRPGTSGVIVDPDRFQINLFLSREYLLSQSTAIEYLPDPVSGPSLVQNVALSLTADTGSGGGTDLRLGGALDTYASVGRTALIMRTLIDQDRGGRIEQLYGQHVWRNYRAATGFLQSSSSPTTTNLRFLGAEFGTFTDTQLDRDRFAASPVEVVLSTRSRVELYRGGALILARDYDAGLQEIDTSRLPAGSYPIRVVVRSGNAIISDETRIYTKASDLPPPGKTYFNLRAGQRIGNIFDDVEGQGAQNQLFPNVTDDLVLQVSASRRIGRASGVTASLLSVASELYPEVSIQSYFGAMRGIAGVTFGPDGGYSMLASLTTTFRGVSTFATVRSVRTDDNRMGPPAPTDRYQPFFRSEDEYSLNAQAAVLGGSLSVRASQTTSPLEEDRYTYGVNYARDVGQTQYGSLRLNVDAFTSDRESRIGVVLTLFRRASRNTYVNASLGAESISGSETEDRNGFGPIASASTSRTGVIRDVDVGATTGIQTDNTQTRAYLNTTAYSRLGSLDAQSTVQQENGDGTSASINLNAYSGFVYGGGRIKLGMRQAGEAAILFDVRAPAGRTADENEAISTAPNYGSAAGEVPATPAPDGSSTAPVRRERFVAVGDYRAEVDNQTFDLVSVGKSAAVALPAYGLYSATLTPRGAPPFDLDLSPRSIPLYPGNVVVLDYTARHVITVYGKVVGLDGLALRNARVEAGQDATLTDDRGYFTITTPAEDELKIRRSDGLICMPASLSNALVRNAAAGLYRLQDVVCRPESLQ